VPVTRERDTLADRLAVGPPDGGPVALAAARRAAWQRLAEEGLPTLKDEDWRYTRASSLFRGRRPRRPAEGIAEGASPNGELPPGVERGPLALSDGGSNDPLDALNLAFLEDGCALRLRGEGERPLVLEAEAPAEGTRHVRHQLSVDGAWVVVEQRRGAGAGLLDTQVEVDLQPGARLVWRRGLVGGGAGLSRLVFRLQAGASVHLTGLHLDHELSRHEIDVHLTGAGASFRFDQVVLGRGNQHVDHHLRVFHDAPETTSRLALRGLLRGRARSVFTGYVRVAPDAVDIDAGQTAHHLLLSPKARVNARPQLEIHADRVKCNHGATVGAMHAEALFFLRQRGLGEQEARGLLTGAFLEPVLAGFLPEDRDRFRQWAEAFAAAPDEE
jgi:Fe-S cluster assembly protein SufD